MHTTAWMCGRFALSLERPLVMGILNVTPDSFSDGGAFEDPGSAIRHGERLIGEGAALVDVGGESTRPGAEPVSVPEELARVRPVVQRLAVENVPVSIDTRHPEVASACLEAGASVLNDISGFRDPRMVRLAAESDCGCVVMHMAGDPQTMQEEPHYDDVVAQVGGFLLAQAAALEAAGVARERIVLDPGIGFGKLLEHNVTLMRGIPLLAAHGYPLLVGVSRKRFIRDITGAESPRERLGGSIAAAIACVQAGASVVRAHDVAQTVQALAVSRVLTGEHTV